MAGGIFLLTLIYMVAIELNLYTPFEWMMCDYARRFVWLAGQDWVGFLGGM